MQLVAAGEGGLQQPGLDQLLHDVLGVEYAGRGQGGAVCGGNVGSRNETQEPEHPGRLAGELTVRQLECRLHPHVTGGERTQSAFLVGRAPDQVVNGPSGADRQPVSGHPQGQRQAPAQLRDLCEGWLSSV
ncbi:hypothetical protein [Streptomyces exfoliatus]|uniref:hypothetical protein n=1 Tax=Streptomyces exfoliatus TaxID=1905 RepID=UPI003C2F6219